MPRVRSLTADPRRRPWLFAAGEAATPWLVAMLTLLAATVRFAHLGAAPLWTDEAFSLWMAKHSLPAIWRWTMRLDAHPPLYYALLHFWLAFGDRETILRALSALIGTLTVPTAYLMGRTIGGTRLGLLTGLLLALSPFNVWYGQETRMYPLLMLTATGALLGLAVVLSEPSARGAWGLYVLAMTAALWTEHTAVLLLITANLITILLHRPLRLTRTFTRRWTIVQLIILVLWSPVLLMLVRQLAAKTAGPTSLNGWGLVASLLPDTFSSIFATRSAVSGGERLGIAALALCVTVPLIGRGLWTWRSDRRWITFLLALWIVPVVCGVLVGLVWSPVFTPATLTAGYRTLIWTSIASYLLIARGLLTLRRRGMRVAAVGMLLASYFAGLAVYYQTAPKWEAWDLSAAYIARRAHKGDLILFNDNLVQLPFDYYFRRSAKSKAVVEHGIPEDFPDDGVREPRMKRADLPRLRAVVRGSRDVWLVYSHEWWTDPQHLVPEALADTGQVVDEQTFPGLPAIRVYLLRERTGR